MLGDDLVPGCQFVCTRAITIDAPPEAVWPWLVQVGFGKAGFYPNDLLDNAAHLSADRITDELQHPQVGDQVPMFTKVSDTTAFKIAAINSAESLLWVKPDSTLTWKLTAVGGRTRLVTRPRARHDWERPAEALISILVMELGDFPMIRKMLRRIKQRAAIYRPRARGAAVRHQISDALGVRTTEGALSLAGTGLIDRLAVERHAARAGRSESPLGHSQSGREHPDAEDQRRRI